VTEYPQQIWSAARPHQWLKNLLVFAPAVLGHARSADVWGQAAIAFIAMCFASSAAYVVNDLVDLPADRAHPTKQYRPLASGRLGRGFALAIASASLVCALLAGWTISAAVAGGILGYIALTVAYSFWIKTILAIDVLLLAGLYCLRLEIGGLATRIPISPWTLTFAMFLFVSLALMKRYAELNNILSSGVRSSGSRALSRRGYRTEDLPAIGSLGSAAAMTAVLVIALYVNAESVRTLYSRPDLLWIICAIVLLWIMRLWLLTNRGEMYEDPVLFALKDPWSIALALAAAIVLASAI
jgi:4-hydroxybenzoate polyprenyltransferase